MKDTDRQTRSHLIALFEQHGIHPRGDLGQNFLIDLNLLEYVVEQAQLSRNDVVLEIGTGTGGMTVFLAQHAGAVISVELDTHVHGMARIATADCSNVTLLNTDALKNKNQFSTPVLEAIERELAKDPERRLKLVANLPYSIATPVVSNLVATELAWNRMVITIQWELGLRMVAKPGGDHFGALSVWLQSQAQVKILKKLNPNVFWPRPQVNSAIVKLTPWEAGRNRIVDRPFFQDFLRRVFTQRRKLLRSTLTGMYRKEFPKNRVDEILAELEFAPDARAEDTEVARLVGLSNRLYQELNPA